MPHEGTAVIAIDFFEVLLPACIAKLVQHQTILAVGLWLSLRRLTFFTTLTNVLDAEVALDRNIALIVHSKEISRKNRARMDTKVDTKPCILWTPRWTPKGYVVESKETGGEGGIRITDAH